MLQRDADGTPTPGLKIRLSDYQPSAWRITSVELVFDLGIASTEVYARLELESASATPTPLRLDGEGLELIELRLNGKRLGPLGYRVEAHALELSDLPASCALESRVRIRPQANTALEGLYLSGSAERGFLLTQCEAQGFRHITWFLDRPDVLTRYSVELRADAARFPVLLAGGNAVGSGMLAEGRHWARFEDPHPKPSYLFALVAGRLQCLSQPYTTADGRAVTLNLWAEADAIGQCQYALGALQRAMRWDEQVYGRNYDLDVFHVVATHDFNMGAMENKGLNIFNAKYLLADADTTTDEGFRAVEGVIGHEYFHNWSGNRVTCRDWFQLSLKEGFTVFRDQSFSAGMHSQALKRIEDVATLRRMQFPEDAGPLAHPVRPAEYAEINNFYTATVYEKGAELIRMLAARIGPQAFRRGTDAYFARHDGSAATVEDLLAALGEAAAVDLTPYLAWYAQAGTPRLSARCHHEPATRRYVLRLAQHTAPTPGQAVKHPLPIPVKLALFARDGRMLPLRLAGEADAVGVERVLELTDAAAEFVFEDIDEAPIPSLLRGFSAPVILECALPPDDLALLLLHDADGFNRWEAGQHLASDAFRAAHAGAAQYAALAAWTGALGALFAQTDFPDAALLAELLAPPAISELEALVEPHDPDAVDAARRRLEQALAQALGASALAARYTALHAAEQGAHDTPAQAWRRLKRRVLELWALVDAPAALAAAEAQFAQAAGMSERLAALRVLLRHGDAGMRHGALAAFRARHGQQPLVMDTWFAVQAEVAGVDALDTVRALLADAAFTLRNPNRVRAVLGTFARQNRTAFHRADGAGYALLVAQLQALDKLNPQTAAALAQAFNGWARLEPKRRALAESHLRALAATPGLSRNLADIVQRSLA
jgi:aminopeptidase N